MSDFGRVVTVHPRREHVPLPVTEPASVPVTEPEIQPAYFPVPVMPSEKAARRRKLWEGPQPEPMTEPLIEPVHVPEKESPPCR
jgi:hypothetical protein